MAKTLIDVSHVSTRNKTLRISIPKSVAEKIGLKQGDIIGYYESDDGIIIENIKTK